MTSIALQRSHDPGTCSACGWRAFGIGLHERTWVQHGVAWTCQSLECISTTKRLISMPIKNADAFEGLALNHASRERALPLLTEAMTALYEVGVRDLDAATPEQFEQAAAALVENGTLQNEFAEALALFGKKLRDDLASDAAPF